MNFNILWILLLAVTVTNSQSICPSSRDFATLNTEVIKASDGVTLQNIRVSWTYSQAYDCSDNMYFLTAETTVEHRGERSSPRLYYYLTLRDNQLEILNPACNARYSVTLQLHRVGGSTYGSHPRSVFFGSSLHSPPSKIPQVFVGSDLLDPNSRLTIFWHPLPCHLQNGDNVTSYILRYSFTNHEEVNRTISTSDDILNCNQEPLGPYRCYLTNSLLLEDELYTFQVAAVNGFGVGQFSDPVNAALYSNVSIPKQIPVCASPPDGSSNISPSSTDISSSRNVSIPKQIPVCASPPDGSSNISPSSTDISSSRNVLIVAGSMVAVVAMLIGIVTVVVLTLCIVWWRRVDSYFKVHHSKVHERSTHGDEIRTGTCQAYNMVTLP